MPAPPSRYVEAMVAVALVTWLTASLLPVLGLASAALLFLLPVLMASARGGVGPGLVSALFGAVAYNFFLLPPRFTFRIHGPDNIISVVVLATVALVTSRLATRLTARETEARQRAARNGEAADLSAMLSSAPAETALERTVAHLGERHGEFRILREAPDHAAPGFSSLDGSAAAWALHNGDMTGHGTDVMAGADWTFLPLSPKNRDDGAIAAVARPADGSTRGGDEIDHLSRLAGLLGQALDRDALESERRERGLLEESDRLRRTFLASLAHDFRTPLTLITGRLALLADKEPGVADALLAAQRLDRTMNDLLAAARIEAGAVAPAIDSVDLVDAVSSACAAVPATTDIRLTARVPADLPLVAADPVLLHQMLVNLLDNAMRHALAAVRITAVHQRDAVLLAIEDDGPGIAAEERERVFGRFARIEGSDRRDGSGLGLAIVKGFADAMAMTVAIEDAEGGGTRMALRMHVRPDMPG